METKFWKDIWPLLLKSPLLMFLLFMTYIMGFGISYFIFSYRKPNHKLPYFLHLFFGLGYTMLMFCIMNFNLIIEKNRDLSLEHLLDNSIFTILISFPVIFIVSIIVVIIRERKK